MGTRHLISVVLDGKYRVAQYGQWDGYFEGRGTEICKFIQNNLLIKKGFDKFKIAVNNCKFISNDKTIEEKFNEFEKSKESYEKKMSLEEKLEKPYQGKGFQFSRDCSSYTLQIILDNNGSELVDSSDFANDSLFCEYAYVLDLDKKILETYVGFNKGNLNKKERFYNGKKTKEGYSPIRLFKKIPFKKAVPGLMKKLEEEYRKEVEKEEKE